MGLMSDCECGWCVTIHDNANLSSGYSEKAIQTKAPRIQTAVSRESQTSTMKRSSATWKLIWISRNWSSNSGSRRPSIVRDLAESDCSSEMKSESQKGKNKMAQKKATKVKRRGSNVAPSQSLPDLQSQYPL